MKRNITNLLQERVTLLEMNDDNTPPLPSMVTTVQRFRDIVNARAFIRPINGHETGMYEIILPMLTILKSKTFSGVRWDNVEYECISVFKEYCDRYLKGNIKRISDRE
ncbi:MAG: hypothetical protein LBL32_02455 [Holosporales bacterium]|jgi:ribosome-binding factor A|nr:hypothetical protein [Holosporales bacterium]